MVDSIPSHFARCQETELGRLGEPASGRIQLLTGPRQVGKTTLLLCAEDWLESARRLGMPAMAWKRFLLAGPAPEGR